MSETVDIAIVGGGMVGASLAMALCSSSRRVALIEGVAPGAGSQTSFDDRTTAIGNGTRAMLETLTSIRRAGADIIITYYAREAARAL